MGKSKASFSLVGVFTIVFLLFSGCQKKEPGFLEGNISIGPLCPVETYPQSSDCLPTLETYKAYPVVIWTSDGKKKITQIYPTVEGYFKIELDPDLYLVTLETGENSTSHSNLPETVIIVSEMTTRFDINIDTGIRYPY